MLEIDDRSGGKIGFGFVRIPPGDFLMGSENHLPFALEVPVHKAFIGKEFFVSRFPVTQEQFRAVEPRNPSVFRHAEKLPVENVNWFEARQFCRNLGELAGRSIRLPTETEWEYVCRAGSTTEFFFGDDETKLSDYAWFESNSREQTSPVGLKKPNAWGVFDMAGNVWEWCEDHWKGDYGDFPADGSAYIRGDDRQPRRAVRGGSWAMDAFRLRSSYRSFDWNDNRNGKLGFRIIWEG